MLNIKDFEWRKIRNTIGKIEVYNPSKEQKEAMKNILKESLKFTNEKDEFFIETNVDEIKFARYMLKELTNFGETIDNVDNETLVRILTNPNGDLNKVLKFELIAIKDELLKEVESETDEQIKSFENKLNEVQKLGELDKISKKLGVKLEDLLTIMQNQNIEKDK